MTEDYNWLHLNFSDDDFFWLRSNVTESWSYDDPPEDEFPSSPHAVAYQVIAVLFLIMSLVGNYFVFYSAFRTFRVNREQVLFLNLAVADLVKTSAIILMYLIVLRHDWKAGNVVCKCFVTLHVLCETCSGYCVVALTLDQFFLLFRPLRREFWWSFLVRLPWMIALLPALSHLYFAEAREFYEGRTFCHRFVLDHDHVLRYTFTFLTLELIVPSLTCIALYGVILFGRNPRHILRNSPEQLELFYLVLAISVYNVVVALVFSIEYTAFIVSDFTLMSMTVHGYFAFLHLSVGAVDPVLYALHHFNLVCFRRNSADANANLATPGYVSFNRVSFSAAAQTPVTSPRTDETNIDQ